MEKKYLKKMLSGLSIASLVAGMTASALAAALPAHAAITAPAGLTASISTTVLAGAGTVATATTLTGAAIAIMNKSLEEVGIDLSTHMRDIDIIMVGKPKSMQDKLRIILEEIMEMSRDTGMIEKNLLLEQLSIKYKIEAMESQKLIARMIKDGTIYEPRPGFLKKV